MSEYLALEDGAPSFRQGFSGPVLLRIPAGTFGLRLHDYHLLRCGFPDRFVFALRSVCRSYNPVVAVTTAVWAVSLSLATTQEIAFAFSSSGYLDVSVPRVGSDAPMCSARSDTASRYRVVPFGDPRINACLQLPAAYRSLPRPSSPAHAKASTIRHK